MRSKMRIIRNRDEIRLIAENGSGSMVWLLAAEICVVGALIFLLASVLPEPDVLALPVMAALGLIGWTIVQMRPDYWISVHHGERQARIVRISPITGARTEAVFPLGDVESLALMQTAPANAHARSWSTFVIAVELRGAKRHVLSEQGPFLAYHESVERFASDAGLGTRVVRMPAV